MSSTPYAWAALDGEVAFVRRARVGTRNSHLNTAAFNTGQLVAGGELDPMVVEDLLLDAAGAVGLPEGDAVATIRSGFKAAESQPRRTPRQISNRTEALMEVAKVADAADAYGWPGHRGKRCIRMLFGGLVVAHEFGGPTDLPLSINRLAVTANNRSRGQIWRAREELIDDGWFRVRRKGAPGRAARFDIQVPRRVLQAIAPTVDDPSSPTWPNYATAPERLLAVPDHDAFHPWALDTTGWRILRYLATHPGWRTQTEVADSLGMSRSTIWRHVRPHRPLHNGALIERDPGGHIRLREPFRSSALDAIALAKGTRGNAERLREALRRHYVKLGWLTPEGQWIDQQTGELRRFCRMVAHGASSRVTRPRPRTPSISDGASSRRPPLTTEEAATYMNVSPRFMRRLVDQRRIAFLKIGRFVRFDPDVLDQFLDEARIEPPSPSSVRSAGIG